MLQINYGIMFCIYSVKDDSALGSDLGFSPALDFDSHFKPARRHSATMLNVKLDGQDVG